VTKWLIVNHLSDREVEENTVFPSVRSGHSEQLHLSFFMWWVQNFMWRCLIDPSQEHAGSGWTRTAARGTCR
jgi:hypothetical protein